MRAPFNAWWAPAAAVALLLAACADEPITAPQTATVRTMADVSTADLVAPDRPERQLVLFSGRAPDLAAQVAGIGGEVVFSHPIGVALVTGVDDAALEGLDAVTEAAPEPLFFLEEPAATSAHELADAAPASHADPTAAPGYARQWNMRAIEADGAWADGRFGSSDVTVAILDTGIDYLYPDLVGRVDLSRSVSFSPDDDFFASIFFPDRHPITDLHYHGTHVAATVTSNAAVMAGVTSDATLMGVKVCSVLGGCPGVIEGILYAADNGADVINMSLGFVNPIIKRDAPGVTSFFNAIFNYVRQQGVTVVVSAGNAALDIQHASNAFQGYCEAAHVICVAATGPVSSDNFRFGPWHDVDAPAPYTNYGRNAITVAAPGGSTGGTVWAGCSTSSLVIPGCQAGIFIIGLNGTSMAAPHTSGLAALVVEDVGRIPSVVRNAIGQGADVISGNSGNSAFYGKGRINVASSID